MPVADVMAYPAPYPAQDSVPCVVADRDGRAVWTQSPVFGRPLRVRVSEWPIAAGSWRRLPYMSGSVPSLDLEAETADEYGVYQYHLGGRAYEHPVGQARVATTMLAGFRLTNDPRFLDRARANCQRLVDTAIRRRGALYLPYRYRHSIARAVMRPTWFSAMAQGLALSALCRMHSVTHEQLWLDTAHQIFASFLNPPLRGLPWTVHTDSCSHLWLEEYPNPVMGKPMRVLNGHIFSAIGVYEYLWLTGDARAAVVFDAAATTIVDHGHEYRVPGSCSNYSLTKPVAKPAYHTTHVWQLNRLGLWTGDQRFLHLSAQFSDDFGAVNDHAAPAPPRVGTGRRAAAVRAVKVWRRR